LNNLLSSYYIDIEELLDDLRFHWLQREDSKFNPHAFKRKPSKSGSNVMICCPVHSETNPSCGIKTEYPYPWHCFGCGASGNIALLVSHALGLKGELQGEHYILKNYITLSAKERKPIDIDSILDGNGLDRKRSLLEDEVKKYLLKRHSYITKRGFSDRTLRKYEIGYDEENRAITFPVRTSKGLIRFIKRRFIDRKGFLNETGIDKRDIVYGLYYIIQSGKQITEIYLNESETDTMACYEARLPAGAILGRILFKEQVKELVKAGIKTVNLFFDNDKHGVEGTIKAYKLLARMTAIRVNVVIYPDGHWGIDGTDTMPYKDANDLLLSGKMGLIQVVPFDEFLTRLKYKEKLDLDEKDWVFY
jgi:DNA primase